MPTPTFIPLRERADLKNKQGPVYSHVWSPDGAWLAIAGYNQVSVWDFVAHNRAAELSHPGYLWGVAWSPDGARLASASQNGTVKVWDTNTYTESASFITGWAFCVTWAPDGQQLAVGTYEGTIQIWDIETSEQIREINGVSPLVSLAWSPDGNLIAAGHLDSAIILWDVESGAQIGSLTGYTTVRSDVNGLAWSPDGQILASAHQDGRVRLWIFRAANCCLPSVHMRAGCVASPGRRMGVGWPPPAKIAGRVFGIQPQANNSARWSTTACRCGA